MFTPEELTILETLIDLDNAYDALPPGPTAGATKPAASFHDALELAREALFTRLGVRAYATEVTLEADEARLDAVRAELGLVPFAEAFAPQPPAAPLPPADAIFHGTELGDDGSATPTPAADSLEP